MHVIKKFYILLSILILGFSSSVHSDELKIGYGHFEKDHQDNIRSYENDMFQITYVYDNKNLPYGLTPIAGALNHSSAFMVYGGVQKKFTHNRFSLIPSFAPGFYDHGSEKDLGGELQFKSQIEFSVELFADYSFSYAWSHISNADIYDSNPGADNEMFFITKKF